PGAIRSRRQFLAAVFVDLDPGAVLRHVRVDPRALGGDEGLAVDREAIVLCALGEKVFLPDDAEGLAFGLAEFAVPGEEARLLQGLAHLPPNNALALLGLELLPHRGLVLARGRGDRAQFLFSRHVARADLVQNGGVDGRQQAQLADLAQGNRERGGDRLFGPVLGGEAFDRAPKVDGRDGGAHDILADRTHMVVVVGILDEDVDLLEADRDGDADAPRAIGDRQFAVLLLRDDRRLEDADRADAGGKGRVGHLAGLDFSGIAGVLLEAAGIDASQFHLFSPGFVSSRVFLEDKIRRARASRPGQRRRGAPGFGQPSVSGGTNPPFAADGRPVLFQSFSSPRPVLRVMSRTGRPAAARFAARTREARGWRRISLASERGCRARACGSHRPRACGTLRSRWRPAGAAGRRARRRRMCRSDHRSKANEASDRGKPPCRRRARRRWNSTRPDWYARYVRMYC